MIGYATEKALEGTVSDSGVRLATVRSGYADGYLLDFDGSGETSGKRYRRLVGVDAVVGDRVMCAMVGGSYVVAGVIE